MSRHCVASLIFSCAWFVASTCCDAATFILGDGDDLGAAIAAAQHLDTIELRSNGVYSSALSWEDKYLTIRAGNGFQPTLQGTIQGIRGNSLTGGTFRGLNINGGISANSTGTRFAKYVFENSNINSVTSIGGTGNFHVDLTVRDSRLFGNVVLSGTGGYSIDGLLERNEIHGVLSMGINSNDAVMKIDLQENDFLTRPVTVGVGANSGLRDFSFRRNRLRQGLDVDVGNFNNLILDLSDNMIGRDITQPWLDHPGILLSASSTGTAASVTGSFVNNSIVGFDAGIEIRGFTSTSMPPQLNLDFANMLLYNRDDLVNVDLADISFSLIADGTYAGQNNNFTAIPLLGGDGQLLAGSPGIDRGNNAKAGIIDILRKARILDGNGDGVNVVDVGAYEFVIPEPSSFAFAVFLAMMLRLRRTSRATTNGRDPAVLVAASASSE